MNGGYTCSELCHCVAVAFEVKFPAVICCRRRHEVMFLLIVLQHQLLTRGTRESKEQHSRLENTNHINKASHKLITHHTASKEAQPMACPQTQPKQLSYHVYPPPVPYVLIWTLIPGLRTICLPTYNTCLLYTSPSPRD